MVTERGVGSPLIRITVDYRSDTLNRWPGIEQRFPNEVRRLSFQRARDARQRMRHDLRRLLAREIRAPFTGRMMAALDARIGSAGGGRAVFPWISWGYFPGSVAGSNQEDENYRALRNYLSAREHGSSGQRQPPVSRIAFWLEWTGLGQRRDAWAVARSLRRGREGAHVLQSYRTSTQYRGRVNGAIRGLARAAFKASLGRQPTSGEFRALGGTLE